MGGLGLMFRRRAIQAHPTISEGGYILSAEKGDAEVLRILMANGVSSDGVGITKEDAAAVTSLHTWFYGSSIKNFDELAYFTGLVSLGSTNCFRNCYSLVSLKLPESTKKIPTACFNGCSSLISVGDTTFVEEIGSEAFKSTAISIVDYPNLKRIDGSGVWTGSQVEEVISLGKITDLPSESNWANGAFRDCQKLKRVNLPSSLLELKEHTFYNCNNLEYVNLEHIRYIRGNVFYNCTNWAQEVVLPNIMELGYATFKQSGISSVDFTGSPLSVISGQNDWAEGMFYSCTNMQKAILGENLQEIQPLAFANCVKLNAIVCLAVSPPTMKDTNVFSSTNNCPIYVPGASVESYKASWSTYASRIIALSEYQG